jgi:hypothetical protein
LTSGLLRGIVIISIGSSSRIGFVISGSASCIRLSIILVISEILGSPIGRILSARIESVILDKVNVKIIYE